MRPSGSGGWPRMHGKATLEHMKVVEEMRRVLRDIRDMNKLNPQ